MRAAPTGAPAPFTVEQRAALDVMMDLLIPASPDGRMPAARTLTLYHELGSMPVRERTLFDEGLATLDALAMQTHGTVFARLNLDQASMMVDRLRAAYPAFVQSFVSQTVGRYLSNPVVMPLIGLEPRPAWPQGNVVAEGDWTLLDVVKRREKIYRKV